MDTVLQIVGGIIAALFALGYVIEHWDTVLAVIALIAGVGAFGLVTWLGYPACLFAYGSGLAWLVTRLVARKLAPSSRGALATATDSVLRSLEDTARWTFVGVATVTLLQVAANVIVKLEWGDVSVLALLEWQRRIEWLNGGLKLVGSPFLFFPIAIGCVWLTYKTRSDMVFRGLMGTRKYLGRAATVVMAVASFSFASHEYAQHLERMWRPRWREVLAEQSALHEKMERRLNAANWVEDQIAVLDDDARQRLAVMAQASPGHEDAETDLRELRPAEPASQVLESELPAPGTFRSPEQELDAFLSMTDGAAPPLQSSRVTVGEARLKEEAKALGVAETIAVEAAKTALSGLLPSGMDEAVRVVVKAIIAAAAKTAVGGAFPRAAGALSRVLRAVDQVLAEKEKARSGGERSSPVVEAEPFHERLADDDARWVDFTTGRRDEQAVFDPPSNHVTSGPGIQSELREREVEREREVRVREVP
jgi:hypothetical protein